MIYLDHAATSDPKPPEVVRAVLETLEAPNGNPGRAGHRASLEAARRIFRAREALAQLLGVADASRLIFTAGATDALNLAIQGSLGQQGGEVFLSSLEHNAVTRPLATWRRRTGGTVRVIPPGPGVPLDLRWLRAHLTSAARLVVVSQVSNVTGEILPVEEVATLCRDLGVRLLVDAAQGAGHLNTRWSKWDPCLVAASGHKGLLGPQGVGLLYVSPDLDLIPTRVGGTGDGLGPHRTVPTTWPDWYEPGTPNTPGIVGLGAAAEVLLRVGLANVERHEMRLGQRLVDGLGRLQGVRILRTGSAPGVTGVVSITVEGRHASEVANVLEERAWIQTRSGLHCAPLAHRTVGTLHKGAVRLSVGLSTSMEDVDEALEALAALAGEPLPQRWENDVPHVRQHPRRLEGRGHADLGWDSRTSGAEADGDPRRLRPSRKGA